MGAGVGKRAAKVRWGTARTMLAAWLVTIPAAGSIAAVAYLLTDALGAEIAGPVVVSVLTSGVLALAGRDGGTPGTARPRSGRSPSAPASRSWRSGSTSCSRRSDAQLAPAAASQPAQTPTIGKWVKRAR